MCGYGVISKHPATQHIPQQSFVDGVKADDDIRTYQVIYENSIRYGMKAQNIFDDWKAEHSLLQNNVFTESNDKAAYCLINFFNFFRGKMSATCRDYRQFRRGFEAEIYGKE